MQHDSTYKRIFSHPELVEELLRDFVAEPWCQQLDFGTLEKLNESYITDDLRQRADDLVWRVRFQGQWLYVYLLLEFQSRSDRWMSVRLLTYAGLLWQDLIRSGRLTSSDKLPPILPIVIYNGEPAWSAPLSLQELLSAVSPSLAAYQPQLRYFLLDEGRVPAEELAERDTTLSELIRLEGSPDPESLRLIVGRLRQRLGHPRYEQLRQTITLWLQHLVLPKLSPEPILEMRDLQEVDNMLAERAEQWAEQWKTAGLEQGIEQGLERGLEQGLERGELLGKIELLQQLLQYPPTPKSELAVFSLSQLHELLQQLQVQLQQQSRTE